MLTLKYLTSKETEWLFEPALNIEQDVGIPIVNALYLVWSFRKDMQELFDLETKKGRLSLIIYWIEHGHEDYEILRITERIRKIFFEPVQEIMKDKNFYLPKILKYIWLRRKDIQKILSLDSTEDLGKILVWWLNFGVKEYSILEINEKLNLELRRLLLFSPDYSRAQQDLEIPLTSALYDLWNEREDLKRIFNLKHQKDRIGLLIWWLLYGYREYENLFLAEHVRNKCIVLLSNNIISLGITINDNDKLYSLYKEISLFIDNNKDLNEIRCYISEFILLNENKNISIPFEMKKIFKNIGKEFSFVEYGNYKETGVNITGFGKGVLGIGEDVRMASKSLFTNNFPFCIYNIPMDIASKTNDLRSVNHEKDKPEYKVNIHYFPASEMIYYFLKHGPKLFLHRYNIGAWQWELPKWPKDLYNAFNFIQEIWSSTAYTADSLKASTSKPVIHMPMAVYLDNIPDFKRIDYNLPEKKYLFLFVFDKLSWYARKNPLANIKAFQAAFKKTNKDVGLVIKCMNAANDNLIWRKVLEYADNDDRIILINETYTRNKVIGLFNCCDSFISLHRAEGFGRCIAEAMLLEKPVIVTNYSGNTDFNNIENSFLVDGPLVEVKKGEYPYYEGQHWCDPDIGLAADQLRKCYYDRDLAEKKAKVGKLYIMDNYNPGVIGRNYIKRIRELGLITGK